jgi:hypothetical protein
MFKSYTPTECIVVPMALRWHFCRTQRGDERRGEGSLTQYRAAPCMALTPATKPRTVMGKRILEPISCRVGLKGYNYIGEDFGNPSGRFMLAAQVQAAHTSTRARTRLLFAYVSLGDSAIHYQQDL